VESKGFIYRRTDAWLIQSHGTGEIDSSVYLWLRDGPEKATGMHPRALSSNFIEELVAQLSGR